MSTKAASRLRPYRLPCSPTVRLPAASSVHPNNHHEHAPHSDTQKGRRPLRFDHKESSLCTFFSLRGSDCHSFSHQRTHPVGSWAKVSSTGLILHDHLGRTSEAEIRRSILLALSFQQPRLPTTSAFPALDYSRPSTGAQSISLFWALLANFPTRFLPA